RAARHIFHDDIGRAILLAKIVYRQNMRMIKLGNGARLADEALHKGGVFGIGSGQYLDSDETIQRRLIGFIHRRHTTLANLLNHLKLSQLLADKRAHLASPSLEINQPTLEG